MKNDILKYKFLFIYYILINLFFQISSKREDIYYIKKLYNYDNEITIKINQNGDQAFIGTQLVNQVNEVYINNIRASKNYNKISLTESTNRIRIIFKSSTYTDLYGLFKDCSTISEIDFSNFNTANTENMQEMFNECTSLTSINFSNFNTDKVTTMCGMFMRVLLH